MKELQQIVKAYDIACTLGFKTALATVVQVEGSAYRHEGARMLIREDGELTGAISGGCLEGDALRKALSAINLNKNMLVTYDTTDDDDAKLGVGLGCNGIIQVLIEPIDFSYQQNPIQLFKKILSKRQTTVLGTFFSLEYKRSIHPGTCLLLSGSGTLSGSIENEAIVNSFKKDATDIMESATSTIKSFKDPAGLKAFVELLKPSVHLLCFGGGNDVIPLVQIAQVMGWETSVIDGRNNYATLSRFPLANRVLVAKPEKAISNLQVDDNTVAVLMTHNYNYDLAVLKQLIETDINYIGLLGPKKKLERMLDDLTEEGIVLIDEQRNKLYGPTGLDIGSTTPEEIALSIISEIKAVLSDRKGLSLRLKTTDNTRSQVQLERPHHQSKFTICPINV